MTRRFKLQLVSLLLLPIGSFVATAVVLKDLYLAINASYLVLLLFLQYIALEEFLLFRQLQELWRTQSEKEMQFVFDPAEFQKPIVKASPKIVLNDANLCNLAKLKYLLGETGSFIPGIRDEVRKLLFINIMLLILLMIITTPNRAASPANNAPANGTTSVASQSSTANSTNERLSDRAEEFLRTQGRLIISYFAVALQLVWLGRVMFHYRQKNADLYFQSTATQSDTSP